MRFLQFNQRVCLFNSKSTLQGLIFDHTRTTNFVDVPILLAIRTSQFFSIVYRTQFSLLLKQKDVFKTPISSNSQTQAHKTNNVRKNTLGFTTGVQLPINKK